MNENLVTPKPQVITLEMITQRRAAKLVEIQQSKEKLSETVNALFSPIESKGGVDGIMQHVNTGIAVYDGVRTGIKIMQRIRGFFRRKKR